MRSLLLPLFLTVSLCASGGMASAQGEEQKPAIAVEKWSGRTIMLIGAHADDDALSHGTLAMLQAHANQIYIVTLTTGNVGTQEPNLSRTQLGQIRRQEELAAMGELGIPAEHYINLGYDDGLLEFEDRKAVVENLVRWITEFVEKKINAGAKYVSQFGPGWKNYKPNLSEAELKQMKDGVRNRIRIKDGKPVEGFRYYRGLPDRDWEVIPLRDGLADYGFRLRHSWQSS
jgi:hypothetical protein